VGLFGTSVDDVAKHKKKNNTNKLAQLLTHKDREIQQAAFGALIDLQPPGMANALFTASELLGTDEAFAKLAQYAMDQGDPACYQIAWSYLYSDLPPVASLDELVGHLVGQDVRHFVDKTNKIVEETGAHAWKLAHNASKYYLDALPAEEAEAIRARLEDDRFIAENWNLFGVWDPDQLPKGIDMMGLIMEVRDPHRTYSLEFDVGPKMEILFANGIGKIKGKGTKIASDTGALVLSHDTVELSASHPNKSFDLSLPREAVVIESDGQSIANNPRYNLSTNRPVRLNRSGETGTLAPITITFDRMHGRAHEDDMPILLKILAYINQHQPSKKELCYQLIHGELSDLYARWRAAHELTLSPLREGAFSAEDLVPGKPLFPPRGL